ncbi:MAG: fumarate reductase subunit [Frankiales bacterium]|jgi:fumarate reductase subunit D|nr:fumarate reductase subunit [Frankiales bacterium]
MRRSSEPLFWSLFSGGGMIMAILAPVLIVVTAYLVPADQVEFGRLHAIFTNFFARLGLIVLAFFTFMHAAHRLRHTLIEIGFKRFAQPIAAGSYLAALAGTVWAAVVAFS